VFSIQCSNAACLRIMRAGEQVVQKIKTSRAEARIGRHAQFKRMADDADTASFATDDSQDERDMTTPASEMPGSLWGAKKRPVQSVGMAPLHSFLTTSQVLAQPLQGQARADDEGESNDWEKGLDREGDWLQAQPKVRQHIGVSSDSVSIDMEYDAQAFELHSAQLELKLFFTNIGAALVQHLTCKAAVPKYMQVLLTPPSTSTLTCNASTSTPIANGGASPEATQTVRLSGISKFKPVKLRLKVEYTKDDEHVEDTLDVNLSQ